MSDRTLATFAVAPLPAVVIVVIVTVCLHGLDNVQPLEIGTGVLGVAFLVYSMAIVGGAPVWLAFRFFRVRSPIPFVIAGAILGVLGVFVLTALGIWRPSDGSMTFAACLHRNLWQMVETGLAGATSGFVFWAMGIRTS